MINKTLDANFLTTLVGAGLGASALEGNGDIAGTAIGLGVGAYVGSQLKIDLPKFDKYIQRNHILKLDNKPVSELDKLKEKLNLQLSENAKGFNFLPDTDTAFDKKDPFKTLTNSNIKSVINDSTNTSELKLINSILKSENNLDKVAPESIIEAFRYSNDITRLTQNTPIDTQLSVLKRYFSDIGYLGADLDKKVELFSGLLSEDKSLIINRHTNTVNIGSTEFKVSSNFAKEGGVSSYVDNDNYYAVRKVNPFADMYLKQDGKIEGRAVAQALGINFADAAKEEAIGKQIEEFAKKGAKPEDLKALLMQSSEFKEGDVDRFIKKSYQHLERESGLRTLGNSQGAIEDQATDLAKNISKQTSVHNVFNLNEDGIIRSNSPFRSFSSTSKSEGGSELQRYIKLAAKNLGLANPQEGIKAGHNHLINTYGATAGLNALAMGERSPLTTGSRENPIYVNKKSTNRVVQAFNILKEKGLVPSEYSTSSAVSRITVNPDNFNLAAKYLAPDMTGSLSDGSSLGKANIRKDYYHSSYKKYDIFSSNIGDMTLSKELSEHVTARANLGISFDAPEIESKRYSNLVTKLERLKVEESNITNDITKNPKNNRLIKDLNRNKQKQKNVTLSLNFNENKAKLEVQKHLSLLDPNSKDAKALSGILTAMNLGTKEGAKSLEEYRSVANKRFKKNTLLGVNPNGREVRLSTEFDDYKLSKSFRSIDSNSDSKSTFVFQGVKDTGTDEVVKDFGVSSKVVVHNLKEEEFNLKYGLAQFLNKTGYVPVETISGLRFDTNELDANKNPILKTLDDVKPMIEAEAAKANSSGVGMITSTKDAGQALSTEIFESLNQGKVLNTIKTLPVPLQNKLQVIVDGINPSIGELNLASTEDVSKAVRGRYWAVSQLATALTENKASSESLMGLGVLGLKNLNTLIDNIEVDPNFLTKESNYALDILVNMFGRETVEDSTGDISSLRATLTDTYLKNVTEVQDLFSQENIGKSVATDAVYSKKVLDAFNLAYLSEGESTHIGSSDTSTIMRLGSGSREKTLSHSGQLHLKMTGGMSSADLALYGDQAPEKIYDLKFSSELAVPVDRELTINSFLDTKDEKYKRNFLNRLAITEPQSIDRFLIEENVPERIRNQDFLYYAMENNNKQNIRTIPIHKYATERVGEYVLDNGNIVFKGLKKDVSDLIRADQDATKLGESFLETFEEAADNLSKTVKDSFLNSKNVQMKGTIALQVPNSTYALARQTANKEFDDVVGRYARNGFSVIGGSREFALEFLKGQGIDVDLSTLSDFIDKDTGLLMTQLTDGSLEKSIFLENREPAQSANSVRSAYMYVLPEQYSGKDSKSFVYHSTLDKHYVELMYADQDGDNTTTYGAKRKLTPEEYNSQKVRQETSARNRNSLIELNELLKIKGKTDAEKPLYSIYDLIAETDSTLDQLGFKKDSPEYFQHLATKQKERIFQGTIKGGVVKTVSPDVTQLAMSLSESAFQMQSYKGVPLTLMDREMMSTLGHGLVENLLKTKHIETGTFSKKEQLPVEALISARDRLSRENTEDNVTNYKKLFREQFDALIPEEVRPNYAEDVEKLLQADLENIRNVRESPSNTMHIAKNTTRIREGGVDQISEITQDIASSRNTTGISQLATETTEINIERSLQVGYNDLLVNAKQNLIKNKFPLMVGAGGLALGALITQKDPDFKPSKKAVADTGSMMLAPNVVSQEQSKQSDPMILKNLGKTVTDFVGPETSLQDISHSVKQTVKIQGSYNNFEREMSDNMKEAIFGNTISNVRIEREYD